MTEKNETIIEWRAAEREHVERGRGWYVAIGGAALALLVFAFFQKNFFFGIFIVIATAMAIALGRTRPKIVEFRLSEEGIGIGENIFYPLENLDGFAITNRPGRLDALVLKKRTTLNPFIKIPIDEKLAFRAKTILAKKIQEFEHNESFIDMLSDWLGF